MLVSQTVIRVTPGLCLASHLQFVPLDKTGGKQQGAAQEATRVDEKILATYIDSKTQWRFRYHLSLYLLAFSYWQPRDRQFLSIGVDEGEPTAT